MKGRALLKSGAIGALIGLGCALGLALVVTLWELVENPGGIFRTAQGWRWDFLLETASSWFLPTLLPAMALATLLALGVRCLLERRG